MLEHMKLLPSATRLSATGSGLVVGLGMPALQAWQSATGVVDESVQFQFVVALTLLFFVPVILFVVGLEYFAYGFKDMLCRPYWLTLKEITLRGICWLCGAGLAFAVLAAARKFFL